MGLKTIVTILCLVATQIETANIKPVAEPVQAQVDTLQRDFQYVTTTTDSLITKLQK